MRRTTIEYTADGERYRVTFEVSGGPDRGWVRREEVRRGCSWRPVGIEPISMPVVDVEDAAGRPVGANARNAGCGDD